MVASFRYQKFPLHIWEQPPGGFWSGQTIRWTSVFRVETPHQYAIEDVFHSWRQARKKSFNIVIFPRKSTIRPLNFLKELGKLLSVVSNPQKSGCDGNILQDPCLVDICVHILVNIIIIIIIIIYLRRLKLRDWNDVHIKNMEGNRKNFRIFAREFIRMSLRKG